MGGCAIITPTNTTHCIHYTHFKRDRHVDVCEICFLCFGGMIIFKSYLLHQNCIIQVIILVIIQVSGSKFMLNHGFMGFLLYFMFGFELVIVLVYFACNLYTSFHLETAGNKMRGALTWLVTEFCDVAKKGLFQTMFLVQPSVNYSFKGKNNQQWCWLMDWHMSCHAY